MSETEVPEKTQTEMAIKLSENVRELIRGEIKEALKDSAFMNSLDYTSAKDHLTRLPFRRLTSDTSAMGELESALKNMLVDKIQRL